MTEIDSLNHSHSTTLVMNSIATVVCHSSAIHRGSRDVSFDMVIAVPASSGNNSTKCLFDNTVICDDCQYLESVQEPLEMDKRLRHEVMDISTDLICLQISCSSLIRRYPQIKDMSVLLNQVRVKVLHRSFDPRSAEMRN